MKGPLQGRQAYACVHAHHRSTGLPRLGRQWPSARQCSAGPVRDTQAPRLLCITLLRKHHRPPGPTAGFSSARGPQELIYTQSM